MGKVTDIDSPVRKHPQRRPKPRSSSITKDEQWQKAVQAYEMLLGGKSHSEVAEALDIAHQNDVWRMLTERFQYDAARLTDAERKEILGMELLRLNALQAAVWPAAMMGDPKSVDSAVRIIQARAKITGIETVDPVVNKNLVLVMGEKEDEYIAALQRVSKTE